MWIQRVCEWCGEIGHHLTGDCESRDSVLSFMDSQNATITIQTMFDECQDYELERAHVLTEQDVDLLNADFDANEIHDGHYIEDEWDEPYWD